MHQMTDDMRRCLEDCLTCHRVCLTEAMQHCLEVGGKHVQPDHFRLMIACAEICQASANLMMIGTDLHKRTCAACAEICEACSQSCEQVGTMDECTQTCRRCAESCRRMAA